jgi:hypothetical protein
MSFNHQLRRVRRILRGIRVLGALGMLLALAAFLWLAFGLADVAAAFEPATRVTLTTVLLAACAVVLLVALLRAVRVPARTAAAVADTALADPRQPAAAALSLDAGATATPLAQLLTTRTLDAAAATLAALPAKRLVPWRFVGLTLAAVLLPLLVIGGLALARPAAFATVAQRLLHPGTDIPPFSKLVFAVTPARPATVYGGELLIAAEITGDALTHPVACLIRQPRTGQVLSLPAFRESPTRFSRLLDSLTEPIEIAFAVGRARSTWLPVEILLEPNILSGVVRLTPPSYTGLPATEFPLDTNEIAAVEGSAVTLELTSNRPLGSATLVFTPTATPGQEPVPQSIDGTLPATQTAAFNWTATRSGRISATLRDLRGTPSPRPLDLAFRAAPDQPPNVALFSPPPMMLATPKSVIPVTGRAQDDFALSKVHFVRTLAGFRDRSHLVAPALREPAYEFAAKLDLDELGLEPGQTIELMLDASDHNPSLLGQGSSEISRIQIISEDQYAQYIRSKTTLDQFASRFQAAREAIDQAREALEKLKEASDKGDPEAIQQAVEAAAKAHERAAELLDKIAEDFPAFELEKRLQDLARKQANDLRENLKPLQDLDPNAPKEERQAAIEEMLDRLGRQQGQAQELNQDLAQVAQAAQLLEMAARFRQIYESQVNLAKRFRTIVEELRQGIDQNRRLLPSLADTQEKNRKALDEFKTELQRRLDALPNDNENLAPLMDSAAQFLNDLTEAAPETLMDEATKHGRAGDAGQAFANAERARALLERLLSEPEPFQQAAKGQAPQFNVPRPDVNQNLAQLLEGLLGQNQGPGQGDQPGGQGQGPGGMGPMAGPASGYSMNLPVVGPDRMQFAPPSPHGGGKNGDGKTPATQPLPETAETGTIKPTDTRHGQSSAVSPEAIPEPYREAVKRFLTP